MARLVAKIVGDQNVLGAGSTCQPGDYYGPPLSAPPLSDGADQPGGADLTGTICPVNGVASGLPTDMIFQTDDHSGGQSQTEVADIEDTSPMQGETVYGPSRRWPRPASPPTRGRSCPTPTRCR